MPKQSRKKIKQIKSTMTTKPNTTNVIGNISENILHQELNERRNGIIQTNGHLPSLEMSVGNGTQVKLNQPGNTQPIQFIPQMIPGQNPQMIHTIQGQHFINHSNELFKNAYHMIPSTTLQNGVHQVQPQQPQGQQQFQQQKVFSFQQMPQGKGQPTILYQNPTYVIPTGPQNQRIVEALAGQTQLIQQNNINRQQEQTQRVSMPTLNGQPNITTIPNGIQQIKVQPQPISMRNVIGITMPPAYSTIQPNPNVRNIQNFQKIVPTSTLQNTTTGQPIQQPQILQQINPQLQQNLNQQPQHTIPQQLSSNIINTQPQQQTNKQQPITNPNQNTFQTINSNSGQRVLFAYPSSNVMLNPSIMLQPVKENGNTIPQQQSGLRFAPTQAAQLNVNQTAQLNQTQINPQQPTQITQPQQRIPAPIQPNFKQRNQQEFQTSQNVSNITTINTPVIGQFTYNPIAPHFQFQQQHQRPIQFAPGGFQPTIPETKKVIETTFRPGNTNPKFILKSNGENIDSFTIQQQLDLHSNFMAPMAQGLNRSIGVNPKGYVIASPLPPKVTTPSVKSSTHNMSIGVKEEDSRSKTGSVVSSTTGKRKKKENKKVMESPQKPSLADEHRNELKKMMTSNSESIAVFVKEHPKYNDQFEETLKEIARYCNMYQFFGYECKEDKVIVTNALSQILKDPKLVLVFKVNTPVDEKWGFAKPFFSNDEEFNDETIDAKMQKDEGGVVHFLDLYYDYTKQLLGGIEASITPTPA
ncbi:hypothetical protein ENU1_201490 [Entamoeba nuttalli P19]|uniref:Uncharacterized protein n=1 Tax=Entamoeba nuttalli (strain P19) TaxID=1076696 RepID=K2G4S6_ENTNP|nr:hypothetical protein ENU1_201490 [Entamoeba nuttalli P19]EKE37316.1 hypothetical protein ENU1_201490 [Entamoeba nuttalli P19]|eukprot:XP_008860350.1 hypothetical protein ENU1_201490 [Entamoeba nuttalli P19]